MKKFIYLTSVAASFFCFVACQRKQTKAQENGFLNTALSDHSSHSYFVPIRIYSNGVEKNYVIENGLFSVYLNKTKGYTAQTYQDTVRKYITNNFAFRFTESLDSFTFLKVDSVLLNKFPLNSVKDTILTYFFTDREGYYIINEAGRKLQNEIVYALFKDGALSKTDNESGSLVVLKDPTNKPVPNK